MAITRAPRDKVRSFHRYWIPFKVLLPKARSGLIAGIACMSLIAISACNSDTPDSSNAPLAQQIRAATAGMSIVDTWYASPLETTPLTTYVIDGEEKSRSVSDLFVVGTVTGVSEGQGYSWPDGPQEVNGPPTEVIHEFNDSKAWMSTIHLAVAVESSLYKDDAADVFSNIEQVTIGLALISPVDLKAIYVELIGQRIVAPLQSNEKTFFRLEPGVYGVLLSGELLGYVDDDDKVTFPALSKIPASPDGSNTINLSDLLNPPTTVSLTKVGGQYLKSN